MPHPKAFWILKATLVFEKRDFDNQKLYTTFPALDSQSINLQWQVAKNALESKATQNKRLVYPPAVMESKN